MFDDSLLEDNYKALAHYEDTRPEERSALGAAREVAAHLPQRRYEVAADLFATALASDAAGREAFDALLDMPDAELWDMITDKGNAPQTVSQLAVLKLIRAG